MDFFQWLGAFVSGGTALGVSSALANFLLKRRKLNDDRMALQLARGDAANNLAYSRLETRLEKVEQNFAEAEQKHEDCEKRLRECADRNQELADQMRLVNATLGSIQGEGQAALIEADAEGNISSWNHAATTLFQWSRTEVIGKPITLLIPHELRRQHGHAFPIRVANDQQAITDGKYLIDQEPVVLESFALRRDGSKIPVSISVTSWEFKGAVVLAAEITRR